MICRCCGVEAPTQYVEFYQNIGALFVRYRKSIKGNLCKSCINQYFWRFTLVNVTLGWWGVISFFLTPFLILNNVIRYLGTLKLKAVSTGTTAQSPVSYKQPVRERDGLWVNTSDDRSILPKEAAPTPGSSIEDLIKYLSYGHNAEFRRLAAELLGAKGAAAVPAISDLIIASVDINAIVRKAAFDALVSIDPNWPHNPEVQKAFPRLTEAFKNSYCVKNAYSRDVSQAAYKLLQQIGQPAVASLAALLTEEEEKIEYKIRAIWLLRDIGPEAASALPQLIQALKDKSSQVRVAAAEALVQFTSVTKVPISTLLSGLADRDADVRKAMVTYLVATEPTTSDLIPFLTDQNSNVRASMVQALIQMGPQTIPVLTETIAQQYATPHPVSETSPRLTGAALFVLGKLGPQAFAANPTIVQALTDPDLNIKFATVQALGSINPNWMSDRAVQEAIASLTEPQTTDPPEKIAAAMIVETFVAIGQNAVPLLIGALESGDDMTRQTAAKALGQIGPEAQAGIPTLTQALEDPSTRVREQVAMALQQIQGPNA